MRPTKAIILALTALTAVLTAGLAAPARGETPFVYDANAAYPEGPLFFQGGLLVAEMGADRVARFAPGEGKRVFFADPGCGPTAVAPYADGLAVLCHLSRSIVRVDAQGTVLGRITQRMGGQPLSNPNDASADGRGGVFFSDPGRFSKDIPAEGALMRLGADGRVRMAARDLWYPNGVHVDRAAGFVYVSEHLAGKIWRYPMRRDGSLGARVLVLDVAPFLTGRYREAGPDGLEIGPDGRLVVALYGEGKVLSMRLVGGRGPLARDVQTIPVPMPYVTNVAFGPEGQAVVVGPRDNLNRPFPGVIMTLPQPR